MGLFGALKGAVGQAGGGKPSPWGMAAQQSAQRQQMNPQQQMGPPQGIGPSPQMQQSIQPMGGGGLPEQFTEQTHPQQMNPSQMQMNPQMPQQQMGGLSARLAQGMGRRPQMQQMNPRQMNRPQMM